MKNNKRETKTEKPKKEIKSIDLSHDTRFEYMQKFYESFDTVLRRDREDRLM